MDTDRTKLILKYMKEGYNQKELPDILSRKENIEVSLSTIEKILKEVRLTYEANNMFHLAFILIEVDYFKEEEEFS